MSCTVFANQNGLFHKGSDGKGSAFPDVCLSPPPAPTGPVPIPYPNKAAAGDLSDGSTTVLVQGQPTALKDQSYTSKTSGDSGGTQGGGLITHKTEGKAYFQFWSLDVLIEGLNVDSHSDPMGQNCGSLLNGMCLRSSVVRAAHQAALASTCKHPYVDDNNRVKPNTEQSKQAAAEFKKTKGCWQCGQPVHDHDDHQPPLVVMWYAGGCHAPDDAAGKEAWKKRAKAARCRPHCMDCSNVQSQAMKAFNKARKLALGL